LYSGHHCFIHSTSELHHLADVPEQGCGSAFISSGSSILGMNTNPDPDLIRIQGFNDQKLKKKIKLKKKFN
jgi:hypothetical protein